MIKVGKDTSMYDIKEREGTSKIEVDIGGFACFSVGLATN